MPTAANVVVQRRPPSSESAFLLAELRLGERLPSLRVAACPGVAGRARLVRTVAHSDSGCGGSVHLWGGGGGGGGSQWLLFALMLRRYIRSLEPEDHRRRHVIARRFGSLTE
mmetsp:Transcript_27847/g.85434  ORF Transcript_27847/g.85434 Transcript_27847/m.85434 type:complete len:112 (+) Transcript_27847:2138-2473(+)